MSETDRFIDYLQKVFEGAIARGGKRADFIAYLARRCIAISPYHTYIWDVLKNEDFYVRWREPGEGESLASYSLRDDQGILIARIENIKYAYQYYKDHLKKDK